MARKISKSSARAKRTHPATIRIPRSWRVVTLRVVSTRTRGDSLERCCVPQIRLSGAWLEEIGFPEGTRYLLSVNREFREIILQAE